MWSLCISPILLAGVVFSSNFLQSEEPLLPLGALNADAGGPLANVAPLQAAANVLNFAPSSLFGILSSQFSLSSGTSVGFGSVLQSVAAGSVTPELASLQCVAQNVVSQNVVQQFSSITTSSFTSIFSKAFTSQTQISNVIKFQQTWVSLIKFQAMLRQQMNVQVSLQQAATQLLLFAPQQQLADLTHGVTQAGAGVLQVGVTVIGMPVRFASVCIDVCGSVVQRQISMETAVLTFITTTRITDFQVNSILSISQLSSAQAAFVPGGFGMFQQFQLTLTKVKSVQTTIVRQFNQRVSILTVAQQLISMTRIDQFSLGGLGPKPIMPNFTGPAPNPPFFTGTAPNPPIFTGPACQSCQGSASDWMLATNDIFTTSVSAVVSSSSETSIEVTFSIVNKFVFVFSQVSANSWMAKIVSQTKMGCPPTVMEYENFFVASFSNTTRVEVSESQLVFTTSSGVATFVRASPTLFPTLSPWATAVTVLSSPVGSFIAQSATFGIDLTLVVKRQGNDLIGVVKLVNSFSLQIVATAVSNTFAVQLVTTTLIGVTDQVAVTENALRDFFSNGCLFEVAQGGVYIVNGETRIFFSEVSQ